MIELIKKENCCGCSACYQACPTGCISMREDLEGFLYPHVDISSCIDCGLCEVVCPVITRRCKSKPLKVYAVVNNNDLVRSQSSSGGVFSLLASEVIKKGGVVFGAQWSANWEVEHGSVESLEGLSKLRGSKYLQSRIGKSFIKVRELLETGIDVLFVGTPCQIAALNGFLCRTYDNLLTIDVACHGTPSPKIWRLYLDEVLKDNSCKESGQPLSRFDISNINFRDKSRGWKDYNFRIDLANSQNKEFINEPGSHNIFMQGFHSDLFLRPSCYLCPSKQGRSTSDITIADLWGVDTSKAAKLNDDKGVSSVIINSKKGESHYSKIGANKIEISSKEFRKNNRGFFTYQRIHPKRKEFFEGLDSCQSISEHIERHKARTPRLARILSKLRAWVLESYKA